MTAFARDGRGDRLWTLDGMHGLEGGLGHAAGDRGLVCMSGLEVHGRRHCVEQSRTNLELREF